MTKQNADKPRLMIVDDEQNYTESLQLAIEDQFSVSVAANLASARQALKKSLPDAVLLDLRLPDGDGLELFQELRNLDPMPVVIVTTAYASVESYVKTLGHGGAGYLLKPLDIEKLKAELKRNIEMKKGGTTE